MRKEVGTDHAAEWVNPADLSPWDRNPRRNDESVENVARSIERFGFGAPIVARREDRRIIAGHTRWKAAQRLGLDRVPVRYLAGLDDHEAAALALADNRLTEVTPWDTGELADVLRELEAAQVDLVGLGWTGEEIAAMIEGVASYPDVEAPEEFPEVDEDIETDHRCPSCGYEWSGKTR
jgi:ParB-like chromosome segregation protein Spo0J